MYVCVCVCVCVCVRFLDREKKKHLNIIHRILDNAVETRTNI